MFCEEYFVRQVALLNGLPVYLAGRELECSKEQGTCRGKSIGEHPQAKRSLPKPCRGLCIGLKRV